MDLFVAGLLFIALGLIISVFAMTMDEKRWHWLIQRLVIFCAIGFCTFGALALIAGR